MPRQKQDTASRRKARDNDLALIGVTLDVEMSMQYPRRGMLEWNYEKGNLNAETKQYTREACRRVRAAGGVLHAFVLGRTFEQKSIKWLKEIVAEGHAVSNHTYDHIMVTARTNRELQHRFRRAPWLVHGKPTCEVIAENIRLTAMAMKRRLGVESAGFRTPYGFPNGLADRPDVQELLQGLGIEWLTSQAVDHVMDVAREKPGPGDYAKIVRAQKQNQPFIYPSGLVEIPASPLGDVFSFRERKWKLEEWLKMIEKNVRWAIQHRAVYDFFSHPSILYVEDPEFRAIGLICDLVRAARGKAAIVNLDTIAQRARLRNS